MLKSCCWSGFLMHSETLTKNLAVALEFVEDPEQGAFSLSLPQQLQWSLPIIPPS
jgi:hypothetical protein